MRAGPSAQVWVDRSVGGIPVAGLQVTRRGRVERDLWRDFLRNRNLVGLRRRNARHWSGNREHAARNDRCQP